MHEPARRARGERRGRRRVRTRDLRAPRACAGPVTTAPPAPDGLPRRSPAVDRRQPAVHAAVPRHARRQGHRRSTRSRSTSTSRRCSGTSGATGPRTARTTPRSRTASARCCARSSTRPSPTSLLVPQVVWGHFPVAADGNDLVVFADDDRVRQSARGSRSRASTKSRGCASRTSSARRVTGPRLRVVHARDDGSARVASGARNSSTRGPLHRLPEAPRPRRRDGRGAGRAVAPAHPRGARLRRRGRPDRPGTVPPAVPRRALLVGLPGVPRPHRQREGRRPCSGASGSASTVSEGFQLHPEQTTDAIVCHHPQAKYFVA